MRSDIKLVDDASVSKLHAIISVEPRNNSEVQYKCVISDLSKYGTYVLRDGEMKKMLINKKFDLEVGDRVRFGTKDSIFTVTFHPFTIARSNLNEEELEKVRNIVKFLGGTLFESWDASCTYLTVPERILFTTKLAYALASAKPIVTIRYWEAIKNAIEESKELPKIDDFLPIMNEEWLHVRSEMFLPKEERKTLFRGLSFVYFCKNQYFTYAPLITAAGGKSCVYPTRKPLTPRDLTAKNAIVIQQPVTDATQPTQLIATDYPIIHSKLSALKRRMISDSEIPLAILNCSTEKYCNPKFDFGTFLKPATEVSSSSDVIIEDTQDAPLITVKNIQNKKQHIIIPETCDTQTDADSTKKAHSSNKNEKRDIAKASKNEIDIVNNTSSDKNHRQSRIIPETCDPLDESIASDCSGQNSEEPQIVHETCKESIASNLSMNKQQNEKNILQENVKFQQREETFVEKENYSILEKNNLVLGRNNPMLGKTKTISERNELISEKDNVISKKDNLVPENTNSVIEKDNIVSKKDSASQNDGDRNYKNSRGPRIISIEKIDNNDNREIHVERVKEKALKKNYSKIDGPQNTQLKKRKSNVLSDSKEYQQEDKRTGEIEIEKRDKRVQQMPQRMTVDQYKKFRLDHKSMDQVLRKELPCGKMFRKAPILIPEKILRADDFISFRDYVLHKTNV